jgi:hypothetical protein
MTFAQFGLAAPLLKAVSAQGYSIPTPIQVQAIPHVLAGSDLLGCAQTGTGKTAAFALPVLHRLTCGVAAPRERGRPIRVLVLSPTRELAAQIVASFEAYGSHTPLRYAVVYGGVSQRPQVDSLRRGVDILVATPGRLVDLINQRLVALNRVETFILDEADRNDPSIGQFAATGAGATPDRPCGIDHRVDRRVGLFCTSAGEASVTDRSAGRTGRGASARLHPHETHGRPRRSPIEQNRRAGGGDARHWPVSSRIGRRSWWRPILRRAASTWTGSRMCSISICRTSRRRTCIASGGRAGPARPAPPCRFAIIRNAGYCRRSSGSSTANCWLTRPHQSMSSRLSRPDNRSARRLPSARRPRGGRARLARTAQSAPDAHRPKRDAGG